MAISAVVAVGVTVLLLTVLTMLALLEHWFMVLPLPDQKLWAWMLPRPVPPQSPRLETRK